MNTTLKEYYIKYLTNNINHRKNLEGKNQLPADISTVIENIDTLSKKEGEGEEQKEWLPDPIKRMILYVLYDGKAIVTSDVLDFQPNKFVIVEAKVILENAIIGCSKKMISFEEIDPFAGYSDGKRNTMMYQMAIGIAESRAITSSGIGLQFKGEMKDYHMNEDENSATKNNEQTEPFNPDVSKMITDVLDKDKEEESDNTATASGASNEAVTTNKDSNNPDSNNVLFGKNAGLPLNAQTPKYLAWMLYQIDTKKEVVPETYRNQLYQLVMNNANAKIIYNTQMKAKETEK